MSHRKPDGDAVGSMLGLAAWLRARGVRAVVLSPGGIPAPYGFVPGADTVVDERPSDLTGYVAVAADAPDATRLAAQRDDLESASVVLNIDHHPDNSLYGDVNVVDPEASSASLVIYDILAPSGGIDVDAATCLYTGLLTDTGGFRFSNTNARTFAAAAALTEMGARPSAAARAVYAEQPLGRLRLLGMVLSSAETALGGRVAILTLTDEMRDACGTSGDDIEGLASYGRLIEGVAVAALLREQGDSIRVSLRSADGVDVNALARELGGGGHRVAAGVVLDGPLDAARARLMEAFGRLLDGES